MAIANERNGRVVVYTTGGHTEDLPTRGGSSHSKGVLYIDMLKQRFSFVCYKHKVAHVERRYTPSQPLHDKERIVLLGREELKAEEFLLRDRAGGRREEGRSGTMHFTNSEQATVAVAWGKIDPRYVAYVATAQECRKLGFEPVYDPRPTNALHVSLIPHASSVDACGQVLPHIAQQMRDHLQGRRLNSSARRSKAAN